MPEKQKPDRRNAPRLKARRRVLRRQTPAEAVLWQRLRNRQLRGRKFRRPYAVGPYIVDFYCAAETPAVELDGAAHDDPARRAYDDERTAFLESQGIRVVRFGNSAVREDLAFVLDAIAWYFKGDSGNEKPPLTPALSAERWALRKQSGNGNKQECSSR